MDAIAAVAMRDCIMVIIKVCGPILCTTLFVGLLVSLLQAVTQINEATLSFLPKAGIIITVFVLLGPFFAGVMIGFSHKIFDQMIIVGGS